MGRQMDKAGSRGEIRDATERPAAALSASTPDGIIAAARLTDPDFGDASAPIPRGAFWVLLAFDPADPRWRRLMDKLEAERRSAIDAARRAHPRSADGAEEVRTPALTRPLAAAAGCASAGWPALRFRMTASGRRDAQNAQCAGMGGDGARVWRRRPVVFDASGRPFWRVPDRLPGSRARVSFRARRYYWREKNMAGLSLELSSVLLGANAAVSDAHPRSAEEGARYV